MAKGDTSTGPGVSNVWSGNDAIGSIGVMVVCNAVSQRTASVRARKNQASQPGTPAASQA